MKKIIILTIVLFLFASINPYALTMNIDQGDKKDLVYEDIAYKKVDHQILKLDIYMPTKEIFNKIPVVIFIHGGTWITGNKKDYPNWMMQTFRDYGYAVVSVDYRLVSQKVHFPKPIEDCKDAVRWIHKNADVYHLDADNIGICGVSSGGQLALLTAYTKDQEFKGDKELSKYPSKVNYVIDYAGPTNLEKMFKLDTPAYFLDKKNRKEAVKAYQIFYGLFGINPIKNLDETIKILKLYSPIYYVKKEMPPTLILHGDVDKMVPIVQSETFFEKGKEIGAAMEFFQIPNGEHLLRSTTKEEIEKVMAEIMGFIQKNTKK